MPTEKVEHHWSKSLSIFEMMFNDALSYGSIVSLDSIWMHCTIMQTYWRQCIASSFNLGSIISTSSQIILMYYQISTMRGETSVHWTHHLFGDWALRVDEGLFFPLLFYLHFVLPLFCFLCVSSCVWMTHEYRSGDVTSCLPVGSPINVKSWQENRASKRDGALTSCYIKGQQHESAKVYMSEKMKPKQTTTTTTMATVLGTK